MKLNEWYERIPELRGEAVRAAPLRGGVANRSFLLTGDFGRWVLRINADVAGVDRERERQVLRSIGGEPWAPAVIRLDESAGYLLYEYRDAPIWTKEAARSPEGQHAVGTWLRTIHSRPAPDIKEVDPVAAFELYLSEVSEGDADALRSDGQEALDAWQAGVGAWSQALVHMDLIATNLLGDGRVEGVIDWEFSGRAEPALDLGFYLHYHDLDLESGAPLFEGYEADGAMLQRAGEALAIADLLVRSWTACLTARQDG